MTARNFSLKFGLLLALLGLAGSAFGRTYTITDFGDDNLDNGNCTLREAIRAANTNAAVDGCGAGSAAQADRINLLAGTYTLNLANGSGEDNALDGDLDILGDLIIEGASSRYTIIDGIAAQSTERVFEINNNAEVVLRDVTITGGIFPTTGAVGFVTSIAVADSGLPVVSYYDLTYSELKVFRCGDPRCQN